MNKIAYKKSETINGGVFISHSSLDSTYKEVVKHFRNNNISFLGDSEILVGENNYQDNIKDMLKMSTGGVVLLSKHALRSYWVMYEIGILQGLGKEITLYFDGDIKQIKPLMPGALNKYNIIQDISTLTNIVSKYSIFNRIFEHETKEIKISDFQNAIKGNIENIIISTKIFDLSEIESSYYKFGYIIIRLAKCGRKEGKFNKCVITNEKREGKRCCLNENKEIKCSFLAEVECEQALETIALNKIMYLSKIEGDRLEYTIPLHTKYGVTFKCFVDVTNKKTKREMVKMLIDAGMLEVSYSESGESQRVYFLLPETNSVGIFQIVSPEGIVNNYFCPGALK